MVTALRARSTGSPGQPGSPGHPSEPASSSAIIDRSLRSGSAQPRSASDSAWAMSSSNDRPGAVGAAGSRVEHRPPGQRPSLRRPDPPAASTRSRADAGRRGCANKWARSHMPFASRTTLSVSRHVRCHRLPSLRRRPARTVGCRACLSSTTAGRREPMTANASSTCRAGGERQPSDRCRGQLAASRRLRGDGRAGPRACRDGARRVRRPRRRCRRLPTPARRAARSRTAARRHRDAPVQLRSRPSPGVPRPHSASLGIWSGDIARNCRSTARASSGSPAFSINHAGKAGWVEPVPAGPSRP